MLRRATDLSDIAAASDALDRALRCERLGCVWHDYLNQAACHLRRAGLARHADQLDDIHGDAGVERVRGEIAAVFTGAK